MVSASPYAARLTVFAALAAGLPAAAADPIEWRTDYHAARAEAERRGVPLLVEVGTEHCLYCRKMDATTFQDPAVAALVRGRFVALRVDGNANPDLVKALKIQMFPTTVMAGPDGKIHAYLQGYVGAEQFRDQAGRAVAAVEGPKTTVVAVRDPAPAVVADRPGPIKRVLNDAKDLALRAVRIRRGPDEADPEATVVASAPRPSAPVELLAAARDDVTSKRFADGLERCDRLKATYPEAPEAAEAAALAAQVRADPTQLAVAADQLAERTAALYLSLADAHLAKNQPREAAACLTKVVRMAPSSRHAEAAQMQLAKLPADAITIPAGYERGR